MYIIGSYMYTSFVFSYIMVTLEAVAILAACSNRAGY